MTDTSKCAPADRQVSWAEGGYRVVVFGAGSGIGAALVARLRRRGARIATADVNPASLDVAPDGSASFLPFAADVTDEPLVARVLDRVTTAWGGVDAVVNCAGILGETGPVQDIDPRGVERVLRVNLFGSFVVTRCALTAMVPAGYGRILHLTSMAGKEGNRNQAAYSASKAGVIGMVKAVAKECATTGVTVNAVAPAAVDTPLLAGLSAADLERQAALIPMGRLGTPDEVAALVEFVISPANTFTTGFVYDASGGRAVY